MFISFTKYVSSVPGLVYKGLDGVTGIFQKNNLDADNNPIVPLQYYNAQVYQDLAVAMLEFREKPNGIVTYFSRDNSVDTSYTITVFNSVDDLLSIADTPWFTDYANKRAAYLKLSGIQSFQKTGDYFLPLTLATTFDDLESAWNKIEEM
jgi:hypothetical protein